METTLETTLETTRRSAHPCRPGPVDTLAGMGAAIVIGILGLAVAFPRIATHPRARWAPACACVALALVFASLFAFVHPAADDFACARDARAHGWLRAQVDSYRDWTGRTVPIALITAIMSAPGNAVYRLTGLALLVASALAAAALVRALFPRHLAWRGALAAGAAFACLSLATMPSPVEGVYWLSGALCYQLGWVLGLVAIALALRAQEAPHAVWFAAIAMPTGFVAASCSETCTALTGAAVLLGGVTRWRATRSTPWPWLGLLAAVACGAAIMALAPGNAVRLRQIGVHPHDAWSTLATLAWAPCAAMGAFLCAPLPWFAAGAGACWGFAHPGPRLRATTVAVAAWGAIGLALAPALWVVGFVPPRALDAVSMAISAAWLGLSLGLGRWLAGRPELVTELRERAPWGLAAGAAWSVWLLLAPSSSDEERLAGGGATVALVLAAMRWRRPGEGRALALGRPWMHGTAAIGVAVTMLACGNLPTAAYDLAIRAPARDRELSARESWLLRYAAVLTSRGGVVQVPLPDPRDFPSTIAYADIGPAPGAWMNQAYAGWFGVPGIAIDPRLPASLMREEPRAIGAKK